MTRTLRALLPLFAFLITAVAQALTVTLDAQSVLTDGSVHHRPFIKQ